LRFSLDAPVFSKPNNVRSASLVISNTSFWKLTERRRHLEDISYPEPACQQNMADYNFGGNDEENAELKKLNAEVV